MALSVPIRYINDGEPLNEETLNRYGLDSQTNLEVLFNTVDGYDPGTVEAEANRVVLRDDQGRSKFGVPTHDQHVWRVAEYKEFREFLLDNADYIRLERLRKASTSQQGIVQLIDSYSSTSMVKAPTANALRDAYQDLLAKIQTVADSQVDLATTIFITPPDNRNDFATTPKAVYDFVSSYVGSNVDDPVGVATYSDILDGTYSSGAAEGDTAASAYAVAQLLDALVSDSGFQYANSTPAGASSPAFTGYFKLPSGLLVQFGKEYIVSSLYTTINLPTSFKSVESYSVVCSEGSADGSWENPIVATVAGAGYRDSTSSSFRIYGKFIVGDEVRAVENIQTVNWVATGEAP